MKQCDMQITRLISENNLKEAEMARKKRILEILKQKADRIAKKRLAVQKYQDFLEDVRYKNSDQYASIQAIVDRHDTLKDLYRQLFDDLTYKENKLKTMKTEFSKYENEQNTRTMQLNNTIA